MTRHLARSQPNRLVYCGISIAARNVDCDATPVLVSLVPGTKPDIVCEMLRRLEIDAHNVVGRSGDTYTRFMAYVNWVTSTELTLRNHIQRRDLENLVFTRKCEILMSMIGRIDRERTYDAPAVNELITAEAAEREAAFGEARNALERQIRRWSWPARFVVLDTSVYVEHLDKLEEIDFRPIIGSRSDDVHILVPILIIEELDGLKNRGDKQKRWRASYTLAVLNKVLPDPTGQGRIREREPFQAASLTPTHGEVTVEIFFDPLHHQRMPVNDYEIIDRVLTAQAVAGRDITLITYDTHQSFSARAAGLVAVKPPEDQSPEPQRT